MVKMEVTQDGVVYRCANPCLLNKRCFVLKTLAPVKDTIVVLQKCPAVQKRDILLTLRSDKR